MPAASKGKKTFNALRGVLALAIVGCIVYFVGFHSAQTPSVNSKELDVIRQSLAQKERELQLLEEELEEQQAEVEEKNELVEEKAEEIEEKAEELEEQGMYTDSSFHYIFMDT